MKQKTISGHYGTVSSLAHNNREFTPKNVDAKRSKNNNYCVAAGHEFIWDPTRPEYVREFWSHYRALSECYWADRSIAQTLEWERYQEHMRALRRLSWPHYYIPENEVEAFLALLLLPLLVPCGIYLSHQQHRVQEEWETFRDEQWLKDMEFRATKLSFRQAMGECDKVHGRQYLGRMDALVTEMAQAEPIPEINLPDGQVKTYRYATVEEIYNKVFEPGFRAFQARQHPSRRYEGTYLEQIREKYLQAEKKHGRRNNRAVSEVIEVLVCVGDMKNTGYDAAPEDAKKSQDLLDDFMEHLLDDPHVCVVTSKELENPDWMPPFRHGMIIANMTGHYDEATPGIHITMIPYSRGCRRGADAQASLGRAMAGMGYPSTWEDVLDENGNKIPKRDKDGNIILEKDGSVRYQQKPDKQGIVDWIEDQKSWLEQEMRERYGWEREYKGSHSRGHLETPQYKAACAEEELDRIGMQLHGMLQDYAKRVDALTATLVRKVESLFDNAEDYELLQRYLTTCTDEEYEEMLQRAEKSLGSLPAREHQKVAVKLKDLIAKAQAEANGTLTQSGKTQKYSR